MKLTKAQRATLKGMFGGVCAYCGKPLGDRWHADHFEPIVRNDFGRDPKAPPRWPERDNVANLMPACAPCNIDKHSMSLEEWRRKLQQACRVLADHTATYRHAVRFGLVQETGARIVFHFETVRP